MTYRTSLLSFCSVLCLTACLQDRAAPIEFKEGTFYERDGHYNSRGEELARYNDRQRAPMPHQQASRYVEDEHNYTVSAALDDVSSSELPPVANNAASYGSNMTDNSTSDVPVVVAPIVPAPAQVSDAQKKEQARYLPQDWEETIEAKAPITPAEQLDDYAQKAVQQETEDMLSQEADKSLQPDMALPPVTDMSEDMIAPVVPLAPTGKALTETEFTEALFVWPLRGTLLKTFAQDSRGIAISGRVGEPVRSAASGVVVHVGDKVEGFGNMVILQHPDKYVTTYAHLSDAVVSVNDDVMQGQLIGFVGESGKVDEPQLHFSIRQSTRPVDPASLLK